MITINKTTSNNLVALRYCTTHGMTQQVWDCVKFSGIDSKKSAAEWLSEKIKSMSKSEKYQIAQIDNNQIISSSKALKHDQAGSTAIFGFGDKGGLEIYPIILK